MAEGIEQVEYDEFGYFQDNAEEYGIPYPSPPVVRREFVELGDGRRLSALVWGGGEPDLVFLHGGAQNAHTWDTVALALGCPLVAIDLPGHGHSDGPSDHPDGALGPASLAGDVAFVVRALAPNARGVVGMSLGGITSIGLAGLAPELVRTLTLVDITPGVDGDKSRAITAFVNGPARSRASPRSSPAPSSTTRPARNRRCAAGSCTTPVQLEDGSWMWRYRRWDGQPGTVGNRAGPPDFAALWDVLGSVTVPVMLVRGMRPQSVVDDADEAELLRRLPNARVERLADAGHSVQGDTPVELARLIEDFAARRR